MNAGKLCFAICEDETYFASRLREMLLSYFQERLLEAEICLFASGEELICSGRRPDVVLMDIKLPGRNGLEIVERLQRAGADSPVIFITAYKEYVFRAFDLEAAHYILKPVRKESCIRHWTGRSGVSRRRRVRPFGSPREAGLFD